MYVAKIKDIWKSLTRSAILNIELKQFIMKGFISFFSSSFHILTTYFLESFFLILKLCVTINRITTLLLSSGTLKEDKSEILNIFKTSYLSSERFMSTLHLFRLLQTTLSIWWTRNLTSTTTKHFSKIFHMFHLYISEYYALSINISLNT